MDGSTSESDGNLIQEDEPEGSQANSNFDRSDSIRSKTVLNRELDKYLAEPMWPRGSNPMVWWANQCIRVQNDEERRSQVLECSTREAIQRCSSGLHRKPK